MACIASADSLQTATWVRLAVIPYVDKVLHNFSTFAFIALHLFYLSGRHTEAVVEILRPIDIMEELRTKIQGAISPPQLATKMIYNVSRWWSLYLNRCEATSS